MSELLTSWLNDEVQLSRRISNFEEDFHNGFLFGELLSKYSQQLNFGEFVDKDDKASRIKNFTLLYDTFKTLRVSFDSNIAMNIIERKVGIAKKVLYELKMQLQKTTSNAFNKMTKPTKPLSPLKKIPVPKEQFDKISKQHFNKQLNQIHSAQKNINLDLHLQKFPQFHLQQLEKVEEEEKKEAQARLLGQMKFREKQLDNIKKSSQFRNDWEQSNMEKWTNNMAVRKVQEEKDTMFKSKLLNTKMQSKTLSQLNAIKSLDKDLKEFEKKTLKKQGDSSSQQSSSQSKPQKQKQTSYLKKLPSVHQKIDSNFGTATFERSKLMKTSELEDQPRTKKNPQEVEIARHQREKRRRKMIVEQSKKHQMIKIQRREKYIVNTLEQTSKQEKEIQYEIWRAWQNREVIVENRKNYNDKVKEKEETRTINAKFKDDELVKTFREEHDKELKDGIDRQNKLKIQNSVRNRKRVYDECKDIIENFINMTEVVYEYGQQKNQQEIDEAFMIHLLDEFVESTKTKKDIAQLELSNYIHGKGQWNLKIKRDNQQQPVDPTQDNSLPNTVVNNYYLGNILKTVFTEIYSGEGEKHDQVVNYENLVAILGLEFAGKSIVSQYIRNNFGFNVISIPQLVSQRLAQYEDIKSKGLEMTGDMKELAQYAYAGKNIPNSLIISLIKENVEKNSKSLVINYPITYQECIEFTKVFGGVQPSEYCPKTKLNIKIEEFSKLVWPTQTKIIPRSLKPCGIDFALWIDISPRTSLDRFLGRRWTPQGTIVHINDEIMNPNSLEVGQKGSSIILQNNFKLKNKQNLENWLSQFGIVVKQESGELIRKCWQSISGECSIDQLTNQVCEILNTSMEIKAKKKMEEQFAKENEKKEEEKRIEREKFEEELKAKCCLSTPDYIQERFKKAMSEVKMDPNFLKGVEKLWNNTEKLTINGFLNVFQALRDQQQAKNRHMSNTKLNFIRMLTREDERFYLVKKFQNNYNKFLDENNDMVIQDFTKEELHQRIDDLELDLLTLIEEKKEDAIAQRDNIMKSGWLESQLEQIMSCIHILLQIQLNRSFACQQIISDFYSKQFLVSTGETQEPTTELNLDNDLQIIKDGNLPRLDKLISEAIRIFNKEQQVVDDKNKKGGKAPPAKKDDKKQAKKDGKEQIKQKAQPTAQDKQYKKAINTEKAIFRYRVKILSAFASKKLKQFQQAGLKLYSDLQDLYKYTDKVENKSVLEMTKIFKRAIENQSKIQNQVQIIYTDVIESEMIRNFKKPKPVILPAAECVQEGRFTISAIKEMLRIIRNQSEAGLTIKNNRLLTLFQELSINQRYRAMLPETWKSLTKANHERFIGKFDKKGKGEIELWIIFTIIALSNCNLPSEQEIKDYELHVTDHNPLTKEIDRARLESTKAWFDSTEPQKENTRFFDRNKYLKQILFEIFKKDDEKLIVDRFLIRVTFAQGRNLELQGLSYFEYAFN